MQMKWRPLPTVITALITGTVLFGGWFIYQQVAVKSPLMDELMEIEGIENVVAEFTNETVHLELTLAQDANLREVMGSIEDRMERFEERQLKIDFNHTSSPQLDEWWSGVLFEIAEAMDQHNYSTIPEILSQHQSELSGMSAAAEMDDQNVYIRLVHDGASKFIVLPRTPAMMGVWPNEQVL